MSLIDVDDVIFDPFVAGQFVTVVRREQEVNEQGEGVETDTTIQNVVASVTPTGDNSLVREEAFSAQAQAIRVITAFRLRGQTKDPSTGQSFLPDIVLWHRDSYVVRTVNDYTPYGAGFIEAECESIDYQQAPARWGS
jgi:galactose-6-phosphate isomerase